MWNRKSKRSTWERLELELQVGQYSPDVIVFLSQLIALPLGGQSCHPPFLGSFLIEEDLTLLGESGSLQFLVLVFLHLLVEAALLTYIVQSSTHFGTFLLHLQAMCFLLN